MKSKLINVRLDADRVRKVKALRAKGVALSDLTREAIDRRYEELSNGASKLDVNAMRERLFAQFPDPPNLPPRDYDVHDRESARAGILRNLKTNRAKRVGGQRRAKPL